MVASALVEATNVEHEFSPDEHAVERRLGRQRLLEEGLQLADERAGQQVGHQQRSAGALAGIPELIRTEDEGLLVTPSDPGALAVVVVISGWHLGVRAAGVNPPELKLWGMDPIHFLIVPISAIVVFAVFVAIGIWKRGTAAIHRPMMFLATLTAVAAATDRIGPLHDLFSGTIAGATWGPYFPPLVLALVLLAIKSGLTRAFDKWFAAGTAVIAVVGIVVMRAGPSPLWGRIASLLVH